MYVHVFVAVMRFQYLVIQKPYNNPSIPRNFKVVISIKQYQTPVHNHCIPQSSKAIDFCDNE